MDLQDFTNTILPVKNQLFRLSLRIVGDVQEAEDVVQEVFIKIWRQRSELGSINNLEAWMMRMTRNLSIDKTRSKHHRTEEIPEGFDAVAQTRTPDAIAESNDTFGKLRSMMHEMPENYRRTMELRDIEGMSYDEIAQVLDMTLSQVKTNLFRARQAMRLKLQNTTL